MHALLDSTLNNFDENRDNVPFSKQCFQYLLGTSHFIFILPYVQLVVQSSKNGLESGLWKH